MQIEGQQSSDLPQTRSTARRLLHKETILVRNAIHPELRGSGALVTFSDLM
jgi:hypothetical protein